VPRHTQRLYRLLALTLDSELYQRLITAEEAIYANSVDPMVNWDSSDLQATFATNRFAVEVDIERTVAEACITATLLERWFASAGKPPTYRDRLAVYLSESEIDLVRQLFWRQLNHQTVP